MVQNVGRRLKNDVK